MAINTDITVQRKNHLKGKNGGEGDRESARRYNRGAQKFAEGGEVESSAQNARKAIDRDPSSHATAEQRGKSRAAEFDPSVSQPRWWLERDEGALGRIVRAIRRDWKQTINDTNPASGDDLDQSVLDTLRQMAGRGPAPIPGEPSGVSHEIEAERVDDGIAFGYEAAQHHMGAWNPGVEAVLANDWARMSSAAWLTYRPYVYLGWNKRRRDEREERELMAAASRPNARN